MKLSIILTAGKKRERRAGQDRQVVPPLVELGDGQLPEEAQLNSTLALKVALEKVTLEEFDPQKAVEEKLRTSTYTKNQINAKAAEGTSLMLNPQRQFYKLTQKAFNSSLSKHSSVQNSVSIYIIIYSIKIIVYILRQGDSVSN